MSIKQSIAGALKQNFLPGLVLQAFAAGLLVLYFFVPASKPIFNWLSDLKQQYGYGYSAVATALFGGIIPLTVMLLTNKKTGQASVLATAIFYVLYWGYKGIEIDFFYRMQAVWFGNDHALSTILSKMAVDQFIYSPFWSVPTIAIPYLWLECNFNFSALRHAMNRTFFLEKLPTLAVSSWLVWIPAVSIIYAMPSELQIPIQNLVLCFWALMLAVLNKK